MMPMTIRVSSISIISIYLPVSILTGTACHVVAAHRWFQWIHEPHSCRPLRTSAGAHGSAVFRALGL